ncbi:Hypothetical predicted protein [Olea europaea subsp. europaea]|uniref:Uncharacterized protein n=1 Tax=Olea europaea subsp. europaea TaxID=158383 RepID=A0A8S0RCJ3_OLEEU|nr:Hypothetical predicted protein [Olea europaea subsp. europaea]
MDNYEYYKMRLEMGNLREVETQTERKTFDYKREIQTITNHKTEGKRMGVRFLVKWKGFKIITAMRANEIMDFRGGEEKLRAYLIAIQDKDLRRFKNMLDQEPELAELLVEEEEEAAKGA